MAVSNKSSLANRQLYSNFKAIQILMPSLHLVPTIENSLQTHFDMESINLEEAKVYHTMYIRPNQSRADNDEFPKGRTLFIANIPVDASLEHMRHFFTDQGIIERVKWATDPTSGSCCHVVFKDEESIDACMAMHKVKSSWELNCGLQSILLSS